MMTSATLIGLLIGGHLKLRTRLLLQTETHALSMGEALWQGTFHNPHAPLRSSSAGSSRICPSR